MTTKPWRSLDNSNSAGSSTVVLELPAYPREIKNTSLPGSRSSSTKDTIDASADTLQDPPTISLPGPNGARPVPELLRWNSSKTTVLRVLATFYSFTILGANDAAYGALIPYLEVYYNVNYTIISLIFLSPVVGYVASALTNNTVHVKFGQRGVAVLVSLGHLISYTIVSLHPPYPVLVFGYLLAGYGNGLADSGFNAWIGDMANANEVLGFLHGMYGLGATLSPLIATTVVTKAGWQWYQFYYLLAGAAALEMCILVTVFRKADGAAYRATNASTGLEQGSQSSSPTSTLQDRRKLPWYQRYNPLANPKSKTTLAIKNRTTLLASFFLLFYVGTEVSIGGWLTSFMLRIRNGSAFASGLSSTGFWLGITVGRFLLGFVTARLFPTEKHAVAFYLTMCIATQLLFWLIPNFLVSAVMAGLLGFWLAPLFPAAIVALTKLLPKSLHVAAVGFASAVGASGATILPFAVGAIASAKGVQVLQPIVLALIVVTLVIWVLIPKLPKQRMA